MDHEAALQQPAEHIHLHPPHQSLLLCWLVKVKTFVPRERVALVILAVHLSIPHWLAMREIE